MSLSSPTAWLDPPREFIAPNVVDARFDCQFLGSEKGEHCR
jgi:hypothetical protein